MAVEFKIIDLGSRLPSAKYLSDYISDKGLYFHLNNNKIWKVANKHLIIKCRLRLGDM